MRLVSSEPSHLVGTVQPVYILQEFPSCEISYSFSPERVDIEEKAFLIEVTLSALQELQYQTERSGSGELVGAACAAASSKVSLSESAEKTPATLESMADDMETPSWSGSAQVAALTNTLTALSLAGVLVTKDRWKSDPASNQPSDSFGP